MSKTRKVTLWTLLALVALAALAMGRYFAARSAAPSIDMAQLMPKYGVSAKRITLDGVQVHYKDEGSGPVLVMLHGSFSSLRMFDAVLKELGTNFRVIRYDQPPSGLSGAVPKDFDLTPEQFLARFLDQLGVESATLLGNSNGGIIAYRFAAAYPERVNALILSNVPSSTPIDTAAARELLPQSLQRSIATCERFSKPWSKVCWRDYLSSAVSNQEMLSDALVTEYYDLNRRPGANELTSITANVRDDNEVRQVLAAVKAPTLLIWGTKDPFLPRVAADMLAARLTSTKAQTRLLDNVGHYPPLEAPKEVSAATLAFLDPLLIR